MKKTFLLLVLPLISIFSSCDKEETNPTQQTLNEYKLSVVRIDSMHYVDEVLKYDSNNQLAKIEIWQQDSTISSIRKFNRNSEGKIESIEYKNSSGTVTNHQLDFIYNANGYLIGNRSSGGATEFIYNQAGNISRVNFIINGLNNGTPHAYVNVLYDNLNNPVEFQAFTDQNGVSELKYSVYFTYNSKTNNNREFFMYAKWHKFFDDRSFAWKGLYSLINAIAPNQLASIKIVPTKDPSKFQLYNTVNTYDNAGNLISQKFNPQNYGGAEYTYTNN